MSDISGFGLRITLLATSTFPTGLSLSQFADDADPLDMAAIQVADKAMGLNGDLITWGRATPVPMIIAVVPNSDDDRNLAALLEANRPARGKFPARDVVTATIVYTDLSVVVCFNGAITDGPQASSISSAGRLKSKMYTFAFENKVNT